MKTENPKANKPLTDEQKADAERLHASYLEWRAKRREIKQPFSQDAFGALCGDYSQSALSQYFNKKIPLNVKALADFCIVLGVPPAEISPTLAGRMAKHAEASHLGLAEHDRPVTVKTPGFTNVRLSSTNTQPGMVYSWDEVIKMFRDGIEDSLPNVFSVEVTDDALVGRARRGDVVTLNKLKRDTVEAGDGILVKTGNDSYMLRIYRPKGDGTYLAEATNPNYLPLHSVDDGLVILAKVVGVPSCEWSRF